MKRAKTIQAARKTGAFTLIELLVVIAIISLLAGMIIPLAGLATTKMRIARVTGELNNLVTAIETYKLQVGEYPPDNGNLVKLDAQTPEWKTTAARSPLYYELNGALFTNTSPTKGIFKVRNEPLETIDSQTLSDYFGRDGIRNSARERADIPFKGFSLKDSQYIELYDQNVDVEVLVVPVPGPFMMDGKLKSKPTAKVRFNPWFYDASSTNRHNRNGFDLWAEIVTKNQTNIIGNWKN